MLVEKYTLTNKHLRSWEFFSCYFPIIFYSNLCALKVPSMPENGHQTKRAIGLGSR